MAKWRPIFKIEGVVLPLPDGYSQSIEDLSSEETGRTLDGQFHKDVIAVKTNMPMKWAKLEWYKAAELANAIDGKTKLNVTYIDVRNAYVNSSTDIYVGQRSFVPVQFDNDGKVYWSVEFSEIEI